MIESVLLRDLGLILTAGAFVSVLTRRAGLPGVVAYMLAGLLLGPATGLVEVSEEIDVLAELGVAFLLFLVGLELSVERVREVGGVALSAGMAQLVLTSVAGLGLGLLVAPTLASALVVAAAVTFSSTAVVVKLLGQRRELGERHGRITLGILLVQDVAVVLTLTLLGALGGEGTEASGGMTGAVLPFVGLAGLGLLALVSTRFGLPALFRWIGSSDDAPFLWSITWCMLFVVISELVHLPLEIGAFVAGFALAQLPEAHGLIHRIGPLTNFFLAVFFVVLGIQMEPAAALGRPGPLVAVVLFVLVGKSLFFYGILARLGEDQETAFRSATSLAQVSEFSFVLVALAAGVGIVDASLLSLVGVAGLITIAVSSLLVVRGPALYRRLRQGPWLRLFGARPAGSGTEEPVPPRSGHVIVVGMNRLGRSLVRFLVDDGHSVLAIDRDPKKVAGLPAPHLLGEIEDADLLVEADLHAARLLVSALRIEDANKLLAYRAAEAGVASSIHAFDPSGEEELVRIGATHLMDPKHEGARKMAEHLRSLGVLSPGGEESS